MISYHIQSSNYIVLNYVPSSAASPPACFGKGQMGSALMGSLQSSCFFDRGTFWVLPLTYFYLCSLLSALCSLLSALCSLLSALCSLLWHGME